MDSELENITKGLVYKKTQLLKILHFENSSKDKI